jgi:hypothetical protein
MLQEKLRKRYSWIKELLNKSLIQAIDYHTLINTYSGVRIICPVSKQPHFLSRLIIEALRVNVCHKSLAQFFFCPRIVNLRHP